MANNETLKFVVELLKKVNLVDQSGQIDADYVAKLVEEVEKRLGLLVMKEMSDEAMLEYTKLVNDGSAQNAEVSAKFFTQHIPNFEQKRQQWLEEFAADFLARSIVLQESLNN